MEGFEKELKEDFLQEANQLLDEIEQAFLKLEHEKDNSDLINEIFRFAHNLKGTSRAVGFGHLAEFTHAVEDLILKIKAKEVEICDNVVSLLLECNDHIRSYIKILKSDMNSQLDNSYLLKKISNIYKLENSFTSLKENETNNYISNSTENKSENELENNNNHEEVNFEHAINDLQYNPRKKLNVGLEINEGFTKLNNKEKHSNHEESIRVNLEKVELLNNYVGELVILQTVLSQRGQLHLEDELMKKSLDQLSKLSREIQDISMSLRMVPMKTTMAKMSRIIRDTSKTVNKKVNLTLIGESTEIDKIILEKLADPLVHIVRNAVDHGLESTEERISLGKNDIGEIIIKAFHEGNNLILEVIDDGKGIDPERIKSKALSKGIISEGLQLSDSQVMNLIFHPGFSTKEIVTEVSGRGVGMDVVKTNIEKLSGKIILNSEKGKGSTFRIQLPLTLAIIEAMVVKVSGERFVIPFAQVSEFLRPDIKDQHSITGMGDCLDLRGEVLPAVFIEESINRKIKNRNIMDKTAIIIRSEDKQFAVMVDEIINQQQVVIKKLGNEIKDQRGMTGSAILGDGKPAIILDLIELFSNSNRTSYSTPRSLERTA